MNLIETLSREQEHFEYHGSTVVERIQRYRGTIQNRDWLLFDTVEEAEDFYNENQVADWVPGGRSFRILGR